MQRIRQINFFFKTIVFNRKLISLPKIQQLETTMLARDLIATVIKTFFAGRELTALSTLAASYKDFLRGIGRCPGR